VVAGLLCDRARMRDLAERLAGSFTVINYDRRGRGESGDTEPYAVEREIEDLRALIDTVGGSSAVYGHSSGAGLALNAAAAAGARITPLILHEPPYGGADEASQQDARELAVSIRNALADGRRADALALFFTASGMPPEVVEPATADPSLLALAPTMTNDFEVMGDFHGGMIPEDVVRRIAVPTLLIAGGSSPDFFRDAADRIAELLPTSDLEIVEGHDHGAPADVVAPVVTRFLNRHLGPDER
jgi:pimeloyl-ACP methyl ester carboxylesterase